MNAIKKFFAPSLEFFTWNEIKQIIISSLSFSRRLVGQHFRLYWWLFLIVLAGSVSISVFLLKNNLVGKSEDVYTNIMTWVQGFELAFIFVFIVSLFLFILLMTFIYASQFVLVRIQDGRELSLKKVFSIVLSHYQIVFVIPVFLVFSWASLIFGDFYALRFFDSVASWRSLRKSVWSGMKLGLSLFPLKMALYAVAGAVVTAFVASCVGAGYGLWWLAQLSSAFNLISVCIAVPAGLVALRVFGWLIFRGIFFSLATQSILYDRVKQKFPDLLPAIVG